MIYSKTIEDLTWNDVESFCSRGVAENAYLDYKESFPKNLEKTIAAMANTFGGIILVGIEEDKNNKPVQPIKGIELERGLEEKVISIILSNITPPIIPEIKVCPDGEAQKAVVVIRIPQSQQTPHAINRNTKVYIRTGNRNEAKELEDLATLDRIDWLKEHRKKSEELKIFLYQQAERRVEKSYSDKKVENDESAKRLKAMYGRLSAPLALFTLSMCPVFPQEPFLNPPAIDKLYSKIRIRDYYGSSDGGFPLPGRSMGLIVNDGSINTLVFKDRDGFWHTELNIFGLYFYRQSLLHGTKRIEGKEYSVIRTSEVLCRLDEYIDSAALFYKEIGFQGLLEFRVNLENLFDHGRIAYLGKYPDDGCWSSGPISTSLDQSVYFSDIVQAGVLHDIKMPLIYNAAKKIAWAFGWDLIETAIDKYYEKEKR